MTTLMKGETLLIVETPFAVADHYGHLNRKQFARMPTRHARVYIAQGLAREVNEAHVPDHETVAAYSELDFLPPPPPPTKPAPIPEGELLRRLGWTADQLAAAASFGFPSATGRRIVGGNGISATERSVIERLWTAAAVEGWIAQVRALVVSLPKGL